MRWAYVAKRIIDIVGALTGLILTLPALIAITILVYIFMGRPILFQQLRPGLNGAPFLLYKFRTMLDSADGARDVPPDDKRLTWLGRCLRATSLDELPELWNVLRGGMSLVGPRPLLMEYLDHYSPEQLRRHTVKPGLTGWAQVNGRNILTWEEKFRLDLWYVDNWSLALDLRILWRTAMDVFRSRGISAPGHATMPKFRGTPPTDPDQ